MYRIFRWEWVSRCTECEKIRALGNRGCIKTLSGKSSDMSQKITDNDQDEIEKHIMRAKQIEEKGSRSPDKKRRRAPKINESDE